MVADAGEVVLPLGPRAPERQRRRRGRRLKADREEHHLTVGVLARDPQRIQRRVHHPHVGPLGLGFQQRLLRPRDAQHVAKAGEDHALVTRDRDPVVDPAHRDHADRATRTVDEFDVRRQQVVDPVLVDRVGMAAADLHHLVVAAGVGLGEDLPGECAAELGVAVLVDVSHRTGSAVWRRESVAARLAIATPAWTSSRSPISTGSTRSISTR